MTKLSGRWTLRALSVDAGWQQGVSITGSSNDGVHALTPGAEIDIESEAFVVTAQALDPATTWIDSLQYDVYAWDDTVGMTVTISADDNPPHGDLDFNDLVVVCLPRDDELVSPHVGLARPDLTIPEQYVRFE